jgi:hypothetical protein
LVKLLVSHRVHKNFHHSFEYIVLAGNSTFFGLIKVQGLFKGFFSGGANYKKGLQRRTEK